MQNNSSVKGNTQARAMQRNVSRELKREEPQSRMGESDITAPIVKSEPFSRGCDKRKGEELKGGPQVGMGKARITHDSRTDGLITNKNEKLNFKGDRMEEAGGFKPNTDMQQGNVLDQPKSKKGWNRDNQVANPDESPR